MSILSFQSSYRQKKKRPMRNYTSSIFNMNVSHKPRNYVELVSPSNALTLLCHRHRHRHLSEVVVYPIKVFKFEIFLSSNISRKQNDHVFFEYCARSGEVSSLVSITISSFLIKSNIIFSFFQSGILSRASNLHFRNLPNFHLFSISLLTKAYSMPTILAFAYLIVI